MRQAARLSLDLMWHCENVHPSTVIAVEVCGAAIPEIDGIYDEVEDPRKSSLSAKKEMPFLRNSAKFELWYAEKKWWLGRFPNDLYYCNKEASMTDDSWHRSNAMDVRTSMAILHAKNRNVPTVTWLVRNLPQPQPGAPGALLARARLSTRTVQ